MRALLLGLLLAACAPSVAFPPAPEALAGAGAGRAWLAGTRGYAALHDGRALVRRDYPMIDGEERYELSTLPAARVFTTDRGAVLVLRTGEVLRSTPAGWLGVGALIAPGDQLDQAASNGDALVVVTNARRLLRLSLAAVARGVLAPLEARAPTYPSWLGWLGEELWMTGWDEGGSVPAAWRLEGAGWRVVARWPSRRATLRGVMRTSAGLHALVGDALWPIDEARPDAERPAEPAPVGGSGLLCAVLGDGAGHHWAETCLRDRVFDPETGASYPIPAREAVFVGVTRDGGFRAFYRDGASILLSPEAPPRARPLNLASP